LSCSSIYQNSLNKRLSQLAAIPFAGMWCAVLRAAQPPGLGDNPAATGSVRDGIAAIYGLSRAGAVQSPTGVCRPARLTFICHSASFGYCFCHVASQVESAFMSSPVIIAALAASLSGFSPPAISVPSDVVVRVAGDCSAAAAQVVADTGGELLSAQPTSDGQCVITVLVPGNGGRPKKVTVKVPM
jgi:hypothetical protein